MRIYSWNVNGIRACLKKGFLDWLATGGVDIVGLQEVRATLDKIPPEALEPQGFHANFFAAKKPGYSGVGIYSTQEAGEVETSMGVEDFDVEGRVQFARFGKLLVVNTYVPNGTGPNRDLSRIPYKLGFSQRLFEMLEEEKQNGGRILVMGDYNTAHKDIDIARPKENEKNSGFRPEERAEIDRILDLSWTDTFRHFNKEPENYSWWSHRAGARGRNIGWRIDYILASPAAMPFVKGAAIHPKVMGSDHCPISVEMKNSVLK